MSLNGISLTNTCPFKQKRSDGFLNLKCAKLYGSKIYFTVKDDCGGEGGGDVHWFNKRKQNTETKSRITRSTTHHWFM